MLNFWCISPTFYTPSFMSNIALQCYLGQDLSIFLIRLVHDILSSFAKFFSPHFFNQNFGLSKPLALALPRLRSAGRAREQLFGTLSAGIFWPVWKHCCSHWPFVPDALSSSIFASRTCSCLRHSQLCFGQVIRN